MVSCVRIELVAFLSARLNFRDGATWHAERTKLTICRNNSSPIWSVVSSRLFIGREPHTRARLTDWAGLCFTHEISDTTVAINTRSGEKTRNCYFYNEIRNNKKKNRNPLWSVGGRRWQRRQSYWFRRRGCDARSRILEMKWTSNVINNVFGQKRSAFLESYEPGGWTEIRAIR